MKAARWIAVLLTIASIAIVTRLRLSRDLTELFPETPEASMLARVTRLFGGGDVALVLLRGETSDDVTKATDEAAAALAACPEVVQVVTGPPAPKDLQKLDPTGAWRFAGPLARQKLARTLTDEGMRQRLHETRALLLAPGAEDVEEWLTKDPLRLAQIPWEGRMELAAGANGKPGGAFSADEGKTRLVVAEPRGRVFDAGAAQRFTENCDAALDPVRAAHPKAKIELTGGHVIARQTELMMETDLAKSGIVSMVLASVMFVGIFRRPRALVAVLPPLVAGTLWTTALATFLYPRLSGIACAFAAVVIGVGVDTGVHVYGRLLQARRDGLTPRAAADVSFRETWRPTLGAAVAAGAAFACLALCDVAGMRQLGVLCGAGEVLTAVAILVVVPEIGCWLERGAPPPPLRSTGVAVLTATRGRAAVAIVLSVGAVIAAIAFGAPALDHKVVTLDQRAIPALATYDAIYAAFGGTRGQLIVVSQDTNEEAARAHADAIAEATELLEQRGVVVGFDALAQTLPASTTQKARLAERDRLDLPSRREALAKALADEQFAVSEFTPALDAFSHPSSDVGDAAMSHAGEWLLRRHLGHDDKGTIVVTNVRLTADPAKDLEARTLIHAADPSSVLTGFTELEASLRRTLNRDLPRVLIVAIGMVGIVLAISLRRVSAVLLAFAVLVVEIAIVLLVARVIGVRWHVYDALVLPVLLGITLDEALFLIEASRTRSIEEALAEQAPLASATALTTAAGFGALVTCRFSGLVDVGKVGALGSTVGLISAFVVIPAGLRLFGRRTK